MFKIKGNKSQGCCYWYKCKLVNKYASKIQYKDSRERYPGRPGSYIRFSEFCILVSKKARKNNEEIKKSVSNKVAKIGTNETANVETTKDETS